MTVGRVYARALLVLFGGCVGLVLLEIGLRVLGYAGAEERAQRRFDPRYGEVNADSWIFDFAIDPVRHRAVDLRGQLIPLAKPPGEQRVLFIGDSATEGAFVTLAQSYPRRFQQLLAARVPDTNVRAINAGVWGMTTLDELHLLRTKLLPLAPDAVVVGLFMANDINFNLAHRQRRFRSAAPAVDFMRQHSALAHVLYLQLLAFNQRRRLLRVNGAGEGDGLDGRWVDARIGLVDGYGLHMLSYPAGELALYMRKPSRLADEAFAVLESAFIQLQALGRAHGFVPRVLLIPSPSSVLDRLAILHHPRILDELQAQGVHVQERDLDFGLPLRRVLATCERLELACVDPTPELRRLGRAAFFPSDEHPTAAGHDALARALLRAP